MFPHVQRPLQQAFFLDRLDRGKRCGAGDGVAAVGATQPAGDHRVHHISAANDTRQRIATRHRLCDGDQIGGHAGVFDGKPFAGPAKARLHFVGDQHDTVLVTDLAELVHHLERHGGITTLAQDGLDDDGGHTFGLRIGQEEVCQAGDRILDRDPVARRWERRAEDIGREGTNVFFVRRDFTRHPQRQQRAPVVAAGKSDHTGAAGCSTGDLDRVFHRLGTGCHQQRFLGRVTGGQRVQLFRQFDIGGVGHNLKAGVRVLVFLRLGCRDHLGVTVAGVQHADAANEVDVAVAIHVPKFRVLGVFRIDRRRRGNAAWNSLFTAGDQLSVGFDRYVCIKHVGHDAAFCRFLCSGLARLLFDSTRHIQILLLKRDPRLKSSYCV